MKNEKKYLLILVLFLLFVITSIQAEKVEIEQNNGLLISTPNQEYIESGESYRFNFHLSRLDDGTYVNDNDTICRFTLYSNKGEIILNKLASYNTDLTNNWHVNVSGGNLTRVGEYNYYISCTDDLNKLGGIRSKQFWVTETGMEFTTQKAISYLGFIVIVLFTFIITLYGASKIPWKNKRNDNGKIISINNFKYIRVFLYTIGYFELMFLFGLSYKFFREAGMEGFTNFFNFIYQFFLHLIYPVMIFLIIAGVVTWLNDKKLRKNLKLGIK